MSLFADFVSAMIDALVEMILLVWDLLGFKRGLLAGALAIVFLVATVAGVVMYFQWQEDTRVANQDATNELINEQLQTLTNKVDQHGLVVQLPDSTLPVQDAWGNQLRVDHQKTALHDTVTVWSTGSDGLEQTSDDLSATQRVMRPKADLAKLASDKAKQAISNRLQRDE